MQHEHVVGDTEFLEVGELPVPAARCAVGRSALGVISVERADEHEICPNWSPE